MRQSKQNENGWHVSNDHEKPSESNQSLIIIIIEKWWWNNIYLKKKTFNLVLREKTKLKNAKMHLHNLSGW